MEEQISNTPFELIIGGVVALFTGGGVAYWRKTTDNEIKAQRDMDISLTKSINDLKFDFLESHIKQQEAFVSKVSGEFSNILLQMTQNANIVNQSIVSLTNVLIENQKAMAVYHTESRESVIRLHERIEAHTKEHKEDIESIKEKFVHTDHCTSKMNAKKDKG